MKRIFVQVDQAGAEALIVSYLCGKGKFRDLFINGIKPHVFVALHVFEQQWSQMTEKVNTSTLIQALLAEPKDLKNVEGWKALENVIKDSDNWEASKRYYFIAKMICHASNYGMKARTFRINVLQKSDGAISKTILECEQMLNKYHALFPEIRNWHNDVILEVKRSSTLRNLFGHPRLFTGHQDESAYKEWFAFVPQSTVGQITNYAITELQEEIFSGKHPADLDILENNHDSILAQCLSENLEYTAKLISTKLNRDLVSPRGDKFRMKSEAQWSDKSWGEMTEI
jgi:DNA polymerase I-like protein with 3'-5' exonuclease and polymerase domains